MRLYRSNQAVPICYADGSDFGESAASTAVVNLANELANRLDELISDTPDAGRSFTEQVQAGAHTGKAIYLGVKDDDWPSWWNSAYDLGIKVASGSDRVTDSGSHKEMHIVARSEQLLLRAIWHLLWRLGWHHYMPNGVKTEDEDLADLWILKKARTTIRISNSDRVWSGCVDHLLPTLVGQTTVLTWSDNSPNSDEGNLHGAIGYRPLADVTDDSWLRHNGWVTDSNMDVGSAWGRIIDHGKCDGDTNPETCLKQWDETTSQGDYTDPGDKLYTNSQNVRDHALEYAADRASSVDWISLCRPDGEQGWEEYFNDLDFADILPADRQIQLANHASDSFDHETYDASGFTIQAYGVCADTPTTTPNSDVCVIVVEAYRPPGRSIENIVADYPYNPVGLYQYPYTVAWDRVLLSAGAADPGWIVAAANRVDSLLPNRIPKVVCGEGMAAYGIYGLGYYCYMRMVLDVGRRSGGFDSSDFESHKQDFIRDMFPNCSTHIEGWYDLLLAYDHLPLLSEDLVRQLYDKLVSAFNAVTSGTDEEKRIAELAKFTVYLDYRVAFESSGCESDYNRLYEWIYRIRDSGLSDAKADFDAPLDSMHHSNLGLDTIFGAVRGTNRPCDWNTDPPSVSEFLCTDGLIEDGQCRNSEHGLAKQTFTGPLVSTNINSSRKRGILGNFYPHRSRGKVKFWLKAGSDGFKAEWKKTKGDIEVEFVDSTGSVAHSFIVADKNFVYYEVPPDDLIEGDIYEIRFTSSQFDIGDGVNFNWWKLPWGAEQKVTVEFGMYGDPRSFGSTHSPYFFVPAGVDELNFYTDEVDNLALYDENGDEDLSFSPVTGKYQSHPIAVDSTNDRIFQLEEIPSQKRFFFLNIPNYFASHPNELLVPSDAFGPLG